MVRKRQMGNRGLLSRKHRSTVYIYIYIYRIANIEEWNWRNWPRRMNDTWTTLEHRFGKQKEQSRGTQRALILYTWSCVSEPRYPGVFHAWFKCDMRDPFWIREIVDIDGLFPLYHFLPLRFAVEFDFINISWHGNRYFFLSLRESVGKFSSQHFYKVYIKRKGKRWSKYVRDKVIKILIYPLFFRFSFLIG